MPRGQRDANEPEIIDALQQAGYEVFQLEDRDHAGLLDLLVVGPMPCPHCALVFEQARLIEVKTKTGALRPEQAVILAVHPDAARLARDAFEAFAALGVRAKAIDRHERRVAQARHHGGK